MCRTFHFEGPWAILATPWDITGSGIHSKTPFSRMLLPKGSLRETSQADHMSLWKSVLEYFFPGPACGPHSGALHMPQKTLFKGDRHAKHVANTISNSHLPYFYISVGPSFWSPFGPLFDLAFRPRCPPRGPRDAQEGLGEGVYFELFLGTSFRVLMNEFVSTVTGWGGVGSVYAFSL